MTTPFPPAIEALPQADIPLKGVTAFLSQAENHQILFMHFKEDVELPEHTHEAQYGIVLEGKIELAIDGKMSQYTKGDRYYIPAGTRHYGKIYAGYTDITFFDQKDRYQEKN